METPFPQDHPFHRKYNNPPRPYIIVPPLTRRQYFKPDDSLSFYIVLIGKANEYLPYFVYAFTEMGRIGLGKGRGKFEVASVEALSLDNSKTEIFSGADKLLRSSETRIDYSFFAEEKLKGDEITLSFETPARIKEHDKLTQGLPFRLLITRLAERAFLLASLHCGGALVDFEAFSKGSEHVQTIKSDLRWVDWERYSSRQQTKMKFGGWIGEITYRGDFQKYFPLLRLGEHIHVGKATTFGLGKYRIRGL